MKKQVVIKNVVVFLCVTLHSFIGNAQVASIEAFTSGWSNQTFNAGTNDQVYMFHSGASISSGTVNCFGSSAGRNSVRPDSNGDFFEVQLNHAGTNRVIDMVSFNVTANSTTVQMAHYGWSTDGTNWVQGAQFSLPSTSSECALVTVAAPLDAPYRFFRIMRNSTSVTWAGTSGGGQTIRIYSMRVWTKTICTTPISLPVTGTTTICSGNNTNVTLASSQSGVTYQLFAGASPSGSLVAGTGSDLNWSVSPTSTTTYTVRTTSADGYCETTMSGSAVITVNQAPTTANAGNDINLTMPTVSTTLAANTANVGTGLWSVVSGPSSNTSQFSSLSSPTATFTADGGAGTYVLRWTISNSPCTPSTDDVTVTIASATAPTISKTSGAHNQTVAASTAIQNVVYTWAGTAIAADITWTGSSITTPSGISVDVDNGNKTITLTGTPSTAGTYHFTVRSTDGSVNSDPLTGTLTVKLPAPSISEATNRTNQGFTANWSDVSGESGYTVNVYQGVNLVKVESGIPANSTSVAISGLSANTTYTYKVIAVGNGSDIPNSDESVASNGVRTLNTAKAIIGFTISGQISSVINQESFLITVSVPQNTNISNLTPTITLSPFATVHPVSGVSQDYTSPVQYVVTAEDGVAQQTYTVNVIYASQLTDFFRSKANGSWTNVSIWESSINNIDWINATITPSSTAANVQVNSQVTINTPQTLGDVIVNANGSILLATGGTISIVSGKQLIVNGLLQNAVVSATNPFSGSGSILINGNFELTVAPVANTSSDATFIPIATWGSNSVCRISGIVAALNADYTQLRGVNQSFNIFEINLTNLLGKVLIQGQEAFGSAVHFIINNTGSGTDTRQGIQLSTSTAPRTGMTVNNYTQNAGLVHIVSNSSNTTGRSFTVNGNFSLNGGVFNVAQYTTNGANTNLTIRGNLTVAEGTILQKDLTTTGSGNHGIVSVIFDGNSSISNNGIIRDLNAVTINSNKSITLNSGTKLTLNSPITNNGVINLLSDATGTATLLTPATIAGTGTASVQQYLTAGRNWYFTSPVSNATSQVIKGTEGNRLWERNVAGNSWTEIAGTTGELTPARGYIAKVGATGVVTFTGTLNHGAVQYPLTAHGVTSGRFHLVGNPYVSYLDWQSVIAANPDLMPTMWFRTQTASDAYMFATVLMSDGAPIVAASNASTTVTKFIPPMQGFWVRMNDNASSANFTVNNTMRSHADQSGNRFKAPANPNQLLRLEISNGTNADEAVLYFNQNASNTFDIYDSPKMFNNTVTVPEIFTRAGNERLVINGMNSYNFNTMLPLGFHPGQAGSFTLRASQLQNFDSDTQVYLLDKTSNTQFNLTSGNSYSFTSDATSTEERFTVLFKSATGSTSVDDAMEGNIYVNSVQGQSKLQINTGIENATLSVYSVSGQHLLTQNVNTPLTILNKTLHVGVYVIKVENKGRIHVLRTVIQ